jgi:hypothetical protein
MRSFRLGTEYGSPYLFNRLYSSPSPGHRQGRKYNVVALVVDYRLLLRSQLATHLLLDGATYLSVMRWSFETFTNVHTCERHSRLTTLSDRSKLPSASPKTWKMASGTSKVLSSSRIVAHRVRHKSTSKFHPCSFTLTACFQGARSHMYYPSNSTLILASVRRQTRWSGAH